MAETPLMTVDDGARALAAVLPQCTALQTL